jgi:hypothetical protein
MPQNHALSWSVSIFFSSQLSFFNQEIFSRLAPFPITCSRLFPTSSSPPIKIFAVFFPLRLSLFPVPGTVPGGDGDGSVEDNRRQGHVEVGAVVEHVQTLGVGRHLRAEPPAAKDAVRPPAALRLGREVDVRAHLAQHLLRLQLGVTVRRAARKDLVFL